MSPSVVSSRPGQDEAAVFLDRDGVLIEDCGYIGSPTEVVWLDDTFTALAKLQQHRFKLFVVTNQSGVAEGRISSKEVRSVNEFLVATLAEKGIAITEVYVCFHSKESGCICRKPSPYFLWKAAKKHRIGLSRSYMIGDHPSDVECARRAGARGLYVLTGHGKKHLKEVPSFAVVTPGVGAAAAWILRWDGPQPEQDIEKIDG